MTRIIKQGDSLQLMRELEDNSVDCLITDPPYIVDTNNGAPVEWRGIKALDKQRTGLNAIMNGFDTESYFNEWQRVLKKFNAFIFCSNKQISELMVQGEKRGYTTTLLVWHKTNTTPFANSTWRPDLEYIVHIRESGATFNGDARLKSKVYISPTEVSKYGHPTEKPLDLIKKFVEIGTNVGDTVLDSFGGSGTTMNACIHLDRGYILHEIDETYYNTIIEREKRAMGNYGLFGIGD